MNIAMASVMSVAADFLNGGLTPRTFAMIPAGFAVGLIMNFIIPYHRINRALFGRIARAPLRSVLSAIPPAVIQTAGIGAVMTAIGVASQHLSFREYLSAYATTTVSLIPIAYVVAFAIQPLAARTAGLHNFKED